MLTFSVARSPTLRSEQRSNSPRSFLCALLSRFSCWQHSTPTAMSVNHLQSVSPIATNRTSSYLTSGHTVQYNVDALVVSTFFFVLFPPTYLHDSAYYNNHYPENRLAITTLRTFDVRRPSDRKCKVVGTDTRTMRRYAYLQYYIKYCFIHLPTPCPSSTSPQLRSTFDVVSWDDFCQM